MKKACANCGKRIPRAVPLCTFCGQAQPQSGPPPPWAVSGDTPAEGTALSATTPASVVTPAPASAATPALAPLVPDGAPAPAPAPDDVPATAPTWAPSPSAISPEPAPAAALLADVAPAEAPEPAADEPPERPPMVQAPLRRPAEPAPPSFEAEPASDEEEPPARAQPARPATPAGPIALPQTAEPPFYGRMRLLQIVAGAVLIALFCLPWQGARSWEMLRYLQGGDFVRQLGLLVGGAVLVSTGLLPVPVVFRAACGALVGIGMLCLGGVMLNVWQRLLGVLVAVLLPGSLLVRTHARRARLPRLLGLMAVLGLMSLYIVPRDDVAPIRVAVDLVYYQRDDMARFIGTYLLLPLPLVSLATVALLGADVAVIGELLGWLLLCWGPGALLVLAIDNTQTYMAAATLGSAACAAYGVADLLRRITKTVEPER